MIKLLMKCAPHGLVERVRSERAKQFYTSAQTRLYQCFIHQGGLVMDVGANRGNRIQAFLNCGAKVVALEPQPACAAAIRAKFFGNQKLTVVETAIGDQPGEIELHLAGDSGIASASKDFMAKTSETGRFGNKGKWTDSIRVQVRTLDSLIAEFGVPDFIKIDVEGFEPQVLRGLSQAVNGVSFEWTPEMPEAALECMNRCRAIGMSHFHLSLGEGMRLVNAESLSFERMEQLITLLKDDATLFGDIYASKENLRRPV